MITLKLLTKGEYKRVDFSQRMKRRFCHPGYELVVQSLARQTKILLNGVTSRLEPVKTRLDALLHTRNVNRLFSLVLLQYNTELLTEHPVKADLRIKSIFTNTS